MFLMLLQVRTHEIFKHTLEKNLISLVQILKLERLLKVLEGFKSFILIDALSM